MKAHHMSKSKIALLVLILVSSLVALLMIMPYMRTIIAGITAGFIFLPLYKLLKRIVRFEWIASIMVLIVILFFLVVPLAISGILIAQELSTLADLSSGQIEDILSGIDDMNIPSYIGGIVSPEELQDYVDRSLSNMAFRSTQWIERMLANSLNFFLSFLVFTFVTYYYMKDHNKISSKIREIIKSLFDSKDSVRIQHYLTKVGSTVNAVIRGTIIMTIIQSALLIPLYYALGLQTPLLWTILTFFVALLPMFGTTIIWLPLTAIVLVRAIMMGDVSMIIIAIVGFGWGTFVANVDNVLRPTIIGKQGKIHPLTILIGILGGLKVFGFAGIFVGPVILTAAFLFIETFLISDEKKDAENNTIDLKKQ
ncbi:MAG: AI-2E family transporter [Candidatus Woesearchaeota archaeon]